MLQVNPHSYIYTTFATCSAFAQNSNIIRITKTLSGFHFQTITMAMMLHICVRIWSLFPASKLSGNGNALDRDTQVDLIRKFLNQLEQKLYFKH